MYQQLKRNYSPSLYISGQKALNIYDDERCTGDWHAAEAWHPQQTKLGTCGIMGVGGFFNTHPYLGNKGIVDVTQTLKAMGCPDFAPVVYAANHARAIADMIIVDALNQQIFSAVTLKAFDDWMPTEQDKQKVYSLLEQAIPHLSTIEASLVKQWLMTAQEFVYE